MDSYNIAAFNKRFPETPFTTHCENFGSVTGLGTWHIGGVVRCTLAGADPNKYNSPSCIFTSMPTGCGLVSMGQVGYLTSEHKEELDIIFKFLKTNGVGAVITAFGDSSTGRERLFTDVFGFIVTSEYRNWQHSGNYKQRLLIKILE